MTTMRSNSGFTSNNKKIQAVSYLMLYLTPRNLLRVNTTILEQPFMILKTWRWSGLELPAESVTQQHVQLNFCLFWNKLPPLLEKLQAIPQEKTELIIWMCNMSIRDAMQFCRSLKMIDLNVWLATGFIFCVKKHCQKVRWWSCCIKCCWLNKFSCDIINFW